MTVGAPASPEKSRPSIFWPLAAIVIPLVGLLARIELRGSENLPRRGAFVLAPNHHSEIDPLIVAIATWRAGRAPRFLAKESLFRIPVVGWVLKASGMVPVARSRGAAAQALAQAKELASSERGVIVYPEGTLTRDPGLWPMRGKSGAIRLALAGDIPLIPLAQWGTQAVMPRYGKLSLLPLRKPITVLIGEPLDVSDLRGRTDQAAIQEGTERLMAAITALLEELRGEKAPPERWDPTQHGQAETGKL
ncbi:MULTISPECIES: lysophospholipid acyltransferase family protein [Microbacterium]|uniref:1-acyl-sn-glycerol-3-phosphate acyltransferase n=1 Tax=Microbacterium barkeri TaxID=33917 RepID=A0A9W6GZY4_9MICO|nr:lysophospholipid acyltransferase family protein [Microbacterium barkeri]GLJ59941.1 1-acyl-sn-glycerol-3-phosphate acyltransferase [Microbacterium barkeri]